MEDIYNAIEEQVRDIVQRRLPKAIVDRAPAHAGLFMMSVASYALTLTRDGQEPPPEPYWKLVVFLIDDILIVQNDVIDRTVGIQLGDYDAFDQLETAIVRFARHPDDPEPGS